MRFLSSLFFALVPSVICSVDQEGRDISDMEFTIDRRHNFGRYPIISGYFSENQNYTQTFRIRTLGPLDHDYEPEDATFVFLVPSNSSMEPLAIPVESTSDRFIDMSFGSEFAHIVGNMMMIPTNPDAFGTNFQMITSATDPAHFCADRGLIMLSLSRIESRRPVISIEVSLRTAETYDYMSLSETFGSFGNVGPYTERIVAELSTETKTLILPLSIRRTLSDAFATEGFSVTRGNGVTFLEPGCDEILARLPTIQLALYSFGNHAGNIFLEPIDYMKVDAASGECRVLVDLGHEDQRDYTLGVTFFERVAVLFDYENRQIGICEPV